MRTFRLLTGAAAIPLAAAALSGSARAETIVSVTQLSYDAEERVQCTAERMNQSAFASPLPAACSLGTQGSDGPDRITKNTYDTAGQLTQVQRAYGTPLQQTYAAYTYSPTGKPTSVTDANGNKASYTYDGFDRLKQWNFPDKVTAGNVSATDYEAYDYDANGNRIWLRKRDGQTISFGYDALNRLTLKDVPGTANDVYSGYDLLGAQTYANFGSATGAGITNNYDIFLRLKSTANNMGATARTLGFQYDPVGNRKQMTYPDGSYFTYTYDALNRLTAIKEAGSAVIVSTSYDAQGRVGSQTRGASTTLLGYDAAARPISWGHDLAGTASDLTTTFAYNGANQIKTKTRSNIAYAFTGYVNVNRPYVVNGLNQYTSAGPAAFGYDANGNLTGDGANSYSYDVENRMTAATVGGVGITLNYDPLGRLWQVVTPAQTLELTHDGDSIVMEVSGGSLLKYVHGPGDDDPMIQYTASGYGGRQSLEPDYQGSIVSVADATGAKVAINTYDEYGIGPSANVGLPPNVGRFQYTGQAWLTQLGLYYYKARMYSPTLGRFMQTDPIGYKDQINLYAYVGNDPIDGKDPTGMFECDASINCDDVEAFRLRLLQAERAFKEGSDEYNRIAGALEKMGTMNDHNGLIVSNGGRNKDDPSVGGSFSNGKLTLYMDTLKDKSTTANVVGNSIPDLYLDIGAAVIGHELDHDRTGPFTTRQGRMDSEISAYTTEDAINRAFHNAWDVSGYLNPNNTFSKDPKVWIQWKASQSVNSACKRGGSAC